MTTINVRCDDGLKRFTEVTHWEIDPDGYLKILALEIPRTKAVFAPGRWISVERS